MNHFHETATLDLPIDILHEDDNFVVVNKPPSYVVYPISCHRMSSVQFILMRERGYKDLKTVHRLDKLTSGVLIFGKGTETSNRLSNRFDLSLGGGDRPVQKQYLALVDGEFPLGKIFEDSPLSDYVVNTLVGRSKCTKPKEAVTEFERLDYDGNVSLVQCTPKTGRTHQIR